MAEQDRPMVRFLDMPDEHIFWYTETGEMAVDIEACSLCYVPTDPKPEPTLYANVLPIIGTQWDEPKPSKHRSKRLWKKLRRKTARPLHGDRQVMVFKGAMKAKLAEIVLWKASGKGHKL